MQVFQEKLDQELLFNKRLFWMRRLCPGESKSRGLRCNNKLIINKLIFSPVCSKDARLPVQLQRAMAAEAEAAREARAKVRLDKHILL